MPRGLRAGNNQPVRDVLVTMAQPGLVKLAKIATGAAPAAGRPGGESVARVIYSLHEDGAKLIEATVDAARQLQAQSPGLLVVPEVFYRLAQFVPIPVAVAVAPPTPAATAVPTMTVLVQGANGTPIPDAAVIAFTNYVARTGTDATTDATGMCRLDLTGFGSTIETLLVYPRRGHWSALQRDVPVAPAVTVQLPPLDLGYTDALRHFYGYGATTDGTGVRVGVIDTGIALDHPDLTVIGGRCTIVGENPSDYGPATDHGTHVAGIIAAHGTAPAGIRGVAPAAAVYSYRVFDAAEAASNFSIIAAIDAAVADKCDLINMSLSGGPRDPATEAAVDDARNAGCACIVAAGNDGRQPVGQPAAYPTCVAVSACGRLNTFPPGTADQLDVRDPFGTDAADFLAAFSNVGPEIDVTGPGVAILSTVPGGYAVMSGTSMATPAITGIAARLLARPGNAPVLNAPRDAARADQIKQMLFAAAQPLGFGYNDEGVGLPRP